MTRPPARTTHPKPRKAANGARGRRPRPVGRIVIVLSTATRKAGMEIAKALIKARVAACVNVVPGVDSVYRWKGRVARAREVLLVIKTTAVAAAMCQRLLRSLHPYDVPEVVVLRSDASSAAYARWVDASTA